MGTARQDAIAAAEKQNPHPVAAAAADRASDVWEPLVQEAYDYMKDRHPGTDETCHACGIVARQRIALGITSP